MAKHPLLASSIEFENYLKEFSIVTPKNSHSNNTHHIGNRSSQRSSRSSTSQRLGNDSLISSNKKYNGQRVSGLTADAKVVRDDKDNDLEVVSSYVYKKGSLADLQRPPNPIYHSKLASSKDKSRIIKEENNVIEDIDQDIMTHKWRRHITSSNMNNSSYAVQVARNDEYEASHSSNNEFVTANNLANNSTSNLGAKALKRYFFRKWNANAIARKEDLIYNTYIVSNRRNKNILEKYFQMWRTEYLGEHFFKCKYYSIGMKRLKYLLKTRKWSDAINEEVDGIFRHYSMIRGLKILENGIKHKKFKVQLENKRSSLSLISARHIIWRYWKFWTGIMERIEDRRRIDEESSERKSKIKMFVSKMQGIALTQKENDESKQLLVGGRSSSIKRRSSDHRERTNSNLTRTNSGRHNKPLSKAVELKNISHILGDLTLDDLDDDQQKFSSLISNKKSQSPPPYQSPAKHNHYNNDVFHMTIPALDIKLINQSVNSKNSVISDRSSQLSDRSQSAKKQSVKTQDLKNISNSSYSPDTRSVRSSAKHSPLRSTTPRMPPKPQPFSQPSVPSSRYHSPEKGHTKKKAVEPNDSKVNSNNRTVIDYNARAKERSERLFQLRKASEEKHRLQLEEQKKEAMQKEEQDAKALQEFRKKKREEIKLMKLTSEYNKTKEQYLQHLIDRSVQHRNKQLVITYGFAPWIKLMELARYNRVRARVYRDNKLVQRFWLQWVVFVEEMRRDRARREYRQSIKALHHYRSTLLRIVWVRWKLLKKILRAKALKVHSKFSGCSCLKRSFKAWKISYERLLRMTAFKMQRAIPQGNKSILKHSFRCWQEFIQEKKLESEARYRAAAMWSKVKTWLKDDPP